MELSFFQADPLLLLLAIALDGLIGDPVYPLHPIRLVGTALTTIEKALRFCRLDGYFGGCLLFVLLAASTLGLVAALGLVLASWHDYLGWAFHLFTLYSLIALRDLIVHGRAIDQAAAAGDLAAARHAASMLAGRDTAPMDGAACRRAGIESLSENAVDGFVTPIFCYLLFGLPGIVLFKVISTMDSMVGNKTPRYLRFGWCGARLDDLCNYLPARLTFGLMVLVAALLPGGSARKALKIGWSQHALVPGPNSGWSEATTAGALQYRLIGPIWQGGVLVTEQWLGDPRDPPAGQTPDLGRTALFVIATCLLFAASATALIALDYGTLWPTP